MLSSRKRFSNNTVWFAKTALYKYLTPQEIQVADLIRKGKRTKEIADMLHTSASTIGTHRNHIRKKLNLKKEGINLRSYLQSLQ